MELEFDEEKRMLCTFPTLYKRNSKGAIQQWEIEVYEKSDGSYVIETRHGKLGGKLQVSSDNIIEGKNQGKANATTVGQQARLEAESKWKKQIARKGYVADLELVDQDQRPGAEPMLAHRYDKYPDKIEFPCGVQPKLDGHRCIAVIENGKCRLYSRQRKEITGLPHICQSLEQILGSANCRLELDGELYNHGYKNNFEELTSHIRNEHPKEGHEIVQYHIYDWILDDVPFEARRQMIKEVFETKASQLPDGHPLVRVQTQIAENHDEVLSLFKCHRADGYEGSILRNLEGLYVGKRSYDLQKVKEFVDAEFKITGVEEGRGKMKGHAIFVCETHEGKEFKAKMKGSMESLAEYFQNSEKYIGKHVTVVFQEYTKDGIPRFPVATRFREDV